MFAPNFRKIDTQAAKATNEVHPQIMAFGSIILDLKDSINALQFETTPIDLVYRSGALFYVYSDDWFYSTVKPSFRKLDSTRLKNIRRRITEGELTEISTDPFVKAIVQTVASFPDTLIVDVGANYGQSAIRYFNALDQNDLEAKILSFEPGEAGKLTPINLELNGVKNVSFYRIAVTDCDDIVPMYFEEGQTQDNKLVNKSPRASIRPVMARRLDTILDQENDFSSLVIKIDTQGAEYEVWSGLLKYREFDNLLVQMEFSPKALSTRVKPTVFLAQLANTHDIYYLDRQNKFQYQVTGDRIEDVVKTVWGDNHPFCDLVLVGKRHANSTLLKSLFSRET